MTKLRSINVKEVIFEIPKTKFAGFAFWSTIESDIAVYCSDLVDPTTSEKNIARHVERKYSIGMNNVMIVLKK